MKPILVVHPFTENFTPEWEKWKQYRKEQHKFQYKSKLSEQNAIYDLVRVSNRDEKTAIAIMNQSISYGWRGFFELRNPIKEEPTTKFITKQNPSLNNW